MALIRRCAAIAPDEFMPAFNLGGCLSRDGKYRESLKHYNRALELAKTPDQDVMALHHLGMAYNDLGENDKAIWIYERALASRPDDKEVGQSRAISWLCQGKLNQGLTEFEVRLHKPARKPIYQSGIPIWKGEDIRGKSVIITHEQGYGDTIQFIRFMWHFGIDSRFMVRRISFAGPPELNALLQTQKNFARGFHWFDEKGPFEADYICSPMAAAAHFGIEYKGVTGHPYMSAEPFALPDRGALKVGIVWQGSWTYSQNARRSMTIDDICPLFSIPGAAFYSLQVGPGAKELSLNGLDGFVADLTCKIKNWSDTARAIMAMDVIVGVDTATMHLAGAMGKRALMLLPYAPCWRWLRGRSDTPWYRNTRLYRQMIPGVWPVNDVKTELERMVHERRQDPKANQPRGTGAGPIGGRSILHVMPEAQGRPDQFMAGH